jgi:hypothetical protein
MLNDGHLRENFLLEVPALQFLEHHAENNKKW